MILGLTGLPGAGKSYYAVLEYIIKMLLTPNLSIYHNITGVNLKEIEFYLRFYYTKKWDALSDEDKDLNSRVHHLKSREEIFNVHNDAVEFSVMVIDEIQFYYGNKLLVDYKEKIKIWEHFRRAKGEKGEFVSEDVYSVNDLLRDYTLYTTKHRKFFHNFVIITQDLDNLSTASKRLLSAYYNFTKSSRFGKKLGKKIYEYDIFNKNGKGEFTHNGGGYGHYKKQVFPCYESYEIEGRDLVELDLNTKNVSIFNAELKYKIVSGIVAMIIVYYALGGFFRDKLKPKTDKSIENKESILKPASKTQKIVRYTSIFTSNDIIYIYTLDGQVLTYPATNHDFNNRVFYLDSIRFEKSAYTSSSKKKLF